MTLDITAIKQWFEVAVPEPTDKSRSVQIGCHYEEVAEMLGATLDWEAEAYVKAVADDYKRIEHDTEGLDKEELLDALCDQIVTAIGTAHMFGMDIQGALNEVSRSNWSKFENGKPVFDQNGKIKKGEGYSKPELARFVKANCA